MRKTVKFLSFLFIATLAFVLMGPLASEAQASSEADAYFKKYETTKDFVRRGKDAGEAYRDYKNVLLKKKPKTPGKLISPLEFGKSLYDELPEMLAGYEREGFVGAAIEGVGALVKIGIGILGKGVPAAAGVKCAAIGASLGGPVGAVIGFGGCFILSSYFVDAIAEFAEIGVEGMLYNLLGILRRRDKGGLFGEFRRGGRTNINVSVDGAVITSATGSGSKATTNIGTSSGRGGEVQVDVHGNIVTIASGRSTARTDVGVASGKGAKVVVNIDGTITTIAAGRSESTTEVGVASGDRSEANVSVDGSVTTIATGRSKARTSVGVAAGKRSKVMVDIDGNIVTLASGAAQSTTEIGVARSQRSNAKASVKGNVVTSASGAGRANAQIGVANGSGNATARIKGNVITVAPGMGRAQTEIGTSSGSRNGSAYVNGTVMTQGGMGSANTKIGTNGSAFVKDVMNFGGSVSIGAGGACQEKRNGQCCLQLYLNRCVTQITPSNHGACPPLWYPVRGLCYFIPDYNHIIRR